MRLLIKLFPVCRRRVSCWSFAVAMAFLFWIFAHDDGKGVIRSWSRDIVGDESKLCL